MEKANQIKEDFLSVMSHELRTPLNVITGYTKLVQEGLMGPVTAEQCKALGKVTHHADELLFMVNSIMHATKIEGGIVEAEKRQFWLSGFLDDLKALYDYPHGKDIELCWEYPNDLPPIDSDQEKLKHVLQNLINNAIKFTDTGIVTVFAQPRPERNAVELGVSDTGIGISAKELAARLRPLSPSRQFEDPHLRRRRLGIAHCQNFHRTIRRRCQRQQRAEQGFYFYRADSLQR